MAEFNLDRDIMKNVSDSESNEDHGLRVLSISNDKLIRQISNSSITIILRMVIIKNHQITNNHQITINHYITINQRIPKTHHFTIHQTFQIFTNHMDSSETTSAQTSSISDFQTQTQLHFYVCLIYKPSHRQHQT